MTLPTVKTPRDILLEAINAGTERRQKMLAELDKETPGWANDKLISGVRDACARGFTEFVIGEVRDDRTQFRAALCEQWGLTTARVDGNIVARWGGLLEPEPEPELKLEKKKGGRPPKEIKIDGDTNG